MPRKSFKRKKTGKGRLQKYVIPSTEVLIQTLGTPLPKQTLDKGKLIVGKKNPKYLSEEEAKMCRDLIKEYGTNYDDMIFDSQLNPHQLSKGQLKKLINIYSTLQTFLQESSLKDSPPVLPINDPSDYSNMNVHVAKIICSAENIPFNPKVLVRKLPSNKGEEPKPAPEKPTK